MAMAAMALIVIMVVAMIVVVVMRVVRGHAIMECVEVGSRSTEMIPAGRAG